MEKEVMSFDDIRVVAQLSDILLLIVKKENVDSEDATGIQVHLNKGEFNKSKINLFTKFTPYTPVRADNEVIQKYYQQLMYKKLSDKILFELFLSINKDE